jgi:hypothetical protein
MNLNYQILCVSNHILDLASHSPWLSQVAPISSVTTPAIVPLEPPAELGTGLLLK